MISHDRPVQQRTVRSETTKDKAGALPSAVYANEPNCTNVSLSTNQERDSSSTERSSEVVGVEVQDVTEVTFVNDCSVAVAVAVGEVRWPQLDEYEMDSEVNLSNNEDEAISCQNATVTRSGRQVRAYFPWI